MLRIPCPNCGVRDETEFRYGGAAHLRRPEHAASDREWTDYLYMRSNPKGIYAELWFNVLRNTVSHAIEATYDGRHSAADNGSVEPSNTTSLATPENAGE